MGKGKTHKKVDVEKELEPEQLLRKSLCFGRILSIFFILMAIFCCYVYYSVEVRNLHRSYQNMEDPPFVIETDRLPMISPDRKVIYVVTEEGLPIANNFVLRNPSVPIEKIVYRKTGANNSIHIFPIQRNALHLTNRNENDDANLMSLGVFAFFLSIIFFGFGFYLIYFYDVFNCRQPGERNYFDVCLNGEKPIDIAEFEAFFAQFDCSPEATPETSPVKKKGKSNKSQTKTDQVPGYVKVTYVEDKEPCVKFSA